MSRYLDNINYPPKWVLTKNLSAGIMRASTVVLIIVSPINLALNVFLVHHTPLRMLGCPVALSITYWLCFILLVLVTALSPTHKANGTWGGLQLQAVINRKGCISFLKLALPGILMIGTEWCVMPPLVWKRLSIAQQGSI